MLLHLVCLQKIQKIEMQCVVVVVVICLCQIPMFVYLHTLATLSSTLLLPSIVCVKSILTFLYFTKFIKDIPFAVDAGILFFFISLTD